MCAQNFLRGLFLGRLSLGRLADEKIGRISRSCCSLSRGASATTRRMCSWRCSGVTSDLPASAALRTGLLALAPVPVVDGHDAASVAERARRFGPATTPGPSRRLHEHRFLSLRLLVCDRTVTKSEERDQSPGLWDLIPYTYAEWQRHDRPYALFSGTDWCCLA